MPRYRLIGGPCNGRMSDTFPSQPAENTTIKCGGALYYFSGPSNPVFQFLDVGASAASSGGTPHAPKAHSGWHGLQVAVNKRMPASFRRTRRLHLATQRKLARLRK